VVRGFVTAGVCSRELRGARFLTAVGEWRETGQRPKAGGHKKRRKKEERKGRQRDPMWRSSQAVYEARAVPSGLGLGFQVVRPGGSCTRNKDTMKECCFVDGAAREKRCANFYVEIATEE